MLVNRKVRRILLGRIKLIVYDFDGVMTDNKIILREDGFESVLVNRADGLAVSIIKRLGIKQIIVSTETNRIVSVRAAKLDIPVIHGIDNKKERIEKFCEDNGINLQNVVYVGNDLNDLDAMKIVGYPVCPSDSCNKIKDISSVILKAVGGSGVVRELLDIIYKE